MSIPFVCGKSVANILRNHDATRAQPRDSIFLDIDWE